MKTKAYYNKVFKLFKEVYGYQKGWFSEQWVYDITKDGIYIYDTTDNVFHGDSQAEILCIMGACSKYYDVRNGKVICRIF